MRSSAASLAMASTAGAWRTRMTLGELLWLDGDAGRDGVVFPGAGAGSLGASCLAMYQSTHWGRYRDLSLILRFEMLPSVLLILNFRASGFPPNKLD